jgi:predicted amidohydrolase
MAGEQSDRGGDVLVAKLRAAEGDMTEVIALLWTWLELNLLDLGSLREKPPTIRGEALAAPPFQGMTDGLLDWVAESPLRNGAELLARIGSRLGDGDVGITATATGFGGEPVVVSWRRSELVKRMPGPDYPPPSVNEQPSLTTLAPSLLVCPAVVEEIDLSVHKPLGAEWELAQRKLESGIVGSDPTLEVHLDSLGEEGLSAWWVDGELAVAALREEDVSSEQHAHALIAVQKAVREASGPSRILVLPELAATDGVLAAIAEELRILGREAPALTVVGRYHHPADDALEHPELGRYVNEAVVLGPQGGVLWTHRKLTSAGGKVPTKDGPRDVTEDILLGRSLTVVGSPLGDLALAICLDAFARHSRERLSRSPANVLFIPSLSPKVLRHQTSLEQLVQVLFGIAFVCNRAPAVVQGKSNWDDPENRSFWAIQRKQVKDPVASDGQRPSFVFRLTQG